MDAVYDLRWETSESTTNYVERTMQVFVRAELEGMVCPSAAPGHAVLRGARLELTDGAAVLAASVRSWNMDKLSAALHTEANPHDRLIDSIWQIRKNRASQ